MSAIDLSRSKPGDYCVIKENMRPWATFHSESFNF